MKKALPQGAEKVAAVRSMFDTIAPNYERVNHLISFGLDTKWRDHAMQYLNLPSNSLVLDIACGTGDFCRLLQNAGHRAIGIDLSIGMLRSAHTSAPLLQADALRLPFKSSSIDGMTCGFALRNFVELQAFFDEAARVLHSGGRVVFLDAARPTSMPVRVGHSLWFGKVVPFIGGRMSDADAYRYLPKSLAYLPDAAELVAMLERAGFTDVRHEALTLGAAQLLTATRA